MAEQLKQVVLVEHEVLHVTGKVLVKVCVATERRHTDVMDIKCVAVSWQTSCSDTTPDMILVTRHKISDTTPDMRLVTRHKT